MDKLKKAQKALQQLRLLKEQGYAVKDEAIAVLQGEVWAAQGWKQIWWCRFCPGWKLELGVRAVGTSCNNGHEAHVLWENSKGLKESLVASVLNQPKSPHDHNLQENNLPLLDNLDKSFSLALCPLPSLKRIDG